MSEVRPTNGTGGYRRSTSRAMAVIYGSVPRTSSSERERRSTPRTSASAAARCGACRGSCSRKSAAVIVEAVVSEPAMTRSKMPARMSSSVSEPSRMSNESRSDLVRVRQR